MTDGYVFLYSFSSMESPSFLCWVASFLLSSNILLLAPLLYFWYVWWWPDNLSSLVHRSPNWKQSHLVLRENTGHSLEILKFKLDSLHRWDFGFSSLGSRWTFLILWEGEWNGYLATRRTDYGRNNAICLATQENYIPQLLLLHLNETLWIVVLVKGLC